MVSQKCQYALRAIFELARSSRSESRELLKIETIAKRQAIPVRFLETILNQLRGGNFVESRRGRHGGYLLMRDPATLSTGEIIRFVDGPIGVIACADNAAKPCPQHRNCVFIGLWTKARESMEKVYDHTTIADLLEEDQLRQERKRNPGINFSI